MQISRIGFSQGVSQRNNGKKAPQKSMGPSFGVMDNESWDYYKKLGASLNDLGLINASSSVKISMEKGKPKLHTSGQAIQDEYYALYKKELGETKAKKQADNLRFILPNLKEDISTFKGFDSFATEYRWTMFDTRTYYKEPFRVKMFRESIDMGIERHEKGQS